MKQMQYSPRSLASATGLLLVGLAALIGFSLPAAKRNVSAQEPTGVSRSWECWTMSIAESSIFRPVVPEGVCGSDATQPTLNLTPRPKVRIVSPIIAPVAPTSLLAAVSGPTVVLTWTAPAGGDPPSSYVIEAGSSTGLSNLANADTGSSTPALTATAVAPGTYFVRVRGRNASGTSAPSNEIIVTVAGGCSTVAAHRLDSRQSSVARR